MTDDHSHCKVCGRVCAAGEETCSRKCAEQREARARGRRTYSYILYATAALLFLLLISHYLV
ncbi:MAG TPA: DUF2116 family Zn-ribbon domain-containing protein [Thermoplasmata archaeon]|nr:DUF2116 family Zn-ribbon domain-containing protein [Thermoplasmata archaeon]